METYIINHHYSAILFYSILFYSILFYSSPLKLYINTLLQTLDRINQALFYISYFRRNSTGSFMVQFVADISKVDIKIAYINLEGTE